MADYFAVVGLPLDPEEMFTPLFSALDLESVLYERRNAGAVGRAQVRNRPDPDYFPYLGNFPFTAEVTDRFPEKDYSDQPFRETIPVFCFPKGIALRTTPGVPNYYVFVSTGSDGRRVYGHTLTIYEPLSRVQRRALAMKIERAEVEMTALELLTDPSLVQGKEIGTSSKLIGSSRRVRRGQEEREGVPRKLAFSSPVGATAASAKVSTNTSAATTAGGGGAVGSGGTTAGGGVAVGSGGGDSVSMSGAGSNSSQKEVERDHNNKDGDGGGGENNKEKEKEDDEESLFDIENESAMLPFELYAPKSLCLLSEVPFMTSFRQFLSTIYQLSMRPMLLPLERYICNFVQEVPLPPPGMAEVQWFVAEKTLRFTRPPLNDPVSCTDLPFARVFQCLGVDALLTLWQCLLLERKIVMHSSQISMLTGTAEVLLALMYPFKWTHVYIPVLSQKMLNVLDAPLPYLVGFQTPVDVDEAA